MHDIMNVQKSLIHICVHIFMKINDLNIHFENKFNFHNFSILIIIIEINPFHYLSAYHLN